MPKQVADHMEGPWHKVKVTAPVGYSLGIVRNEMGVLELVVKPSGEDWAHGVQPTGGVMEIEKGCTTYAVIMG